MPIVGSRLRELRDARDLRQEDVANVVGVTPEAIGMYEHNKREPKAEILTRLADFFDVNLDYLLGRTDDPRPIGKAAHFGARLRQLRQIRGLSIEDLTRQCDLNIAELEQQKTPPSHSTMTRLAGVLRVEQEYLTYEGPNLFEILSEMPSEIRTALLSREFIPYIKYSHAAMKSGISPETFGAMIEGLSHALRELDKKPRPSSPESQ